MKIRHAISLMGLSAAAMMIVAFLQGQPILGAVCLVMSAAPIMTASGQKQIWRPWFMEGVEAPEPDCSLFCWQALTFDAIVIAGIISHEPAVLIVLRVVGLMLQFSVIGRFANDHTPHPDPKNEISRKSTSSPDARLPRKPDV